MVSEEEVDSVSDKSRLRISGPELSSDGYFQLASGPAVWYRRTLVFPILCTSQHSLPPYFEK